MPAPRGSSPTGTRVAGGRLDAEGQVHPDGCACLAEGHCAIDLDLHAERQLEQAIAADELVEIVEEDGSRSLVRGSELRA